MFLSAISVPCAPGGRSARLLSASAALTLLAGCGGGGGGGAPPPATVNQAPAFTSGTSAAVVENSGGSVYQAAATDPEGVAVAFSIVGGADAARFNVSPGGQLVFVTPPNFDLPTDADGNNVYLVDIGASDGQVRSTLTVAVTVSNSKEGISVRRIATAHAPLVAIASAGDAQFLVADGLGGIYLYNLQNGSRRFLTALPSGSTSQGVLAIVAANDFAGSGRFVVMHHSLSSLYIQEYARDSFGVTGRDYNGRNLGIPAPDYAGGGWLGFDPQGSLLVATGDAGGIGDPTGSAQNDSSFLGKLVRVTPNGDPFACAAACYFSFTKVAKGLHQPVGGFTHADGTLIGDRGQAVADEVNFFATGAGGINFGWPFKEGFRIVQGTPPANVVDPVTEYSRLGSTAVQGNVGGAIPGNSIASIAGHYVFADRSGAIFSFPAGLLQNARTTTERRTADFAPDAGAIEQPVAMVADSTGRLYILDADGEIFRVDAG